MGRLQLGKKFSDQQNAQIVAFPQDSGWRAAQLDSADSGAIDR